MKKAGLVVFYLWSACSVVLADGLVRALAFNSDIRVQSEGSMVVSETIRVDVLGEGTRGGIYREIQTRYQGVSGRPMNLDLNVLEVMLDNEPVDYNVLSRKDGIRVFIGDHNSVIPPGEHVFSLSYFVDRELEYFKDRDTLSWNLTGTGWPFILEHVSASVELPEGAVGKVMHVEAFVGNNQKDKGSVSRSQDYWGRLLFVVTRPLAIKEGFLIRVSWPKGFVRELTAAQKIGYLIHDHISFVTGILGLLALLGYVFVMRVRMGQPDTTRSTELLVRPSEEFSPATARFLMRKGYDGRVLYAAIVSLALKRYIRIEENNGQFYLVNLGSGKESLSVEEKVLFANLFVGSDYLLLGAENADVFAVAVTRFKVGLKNATERMYFQVNLKTYFVGVLISIVMVLSSVFFYVRFSEGLLPLLFWLTCWVAAASTTISIAIRAWLDRPENVVRTVLWSISALVMFAGIVFFVDVLTTWGLFLCVSAVSINAVFYYLLKPPLLLEQLVVDQMQGFKLYLSCTGGAHELPESRPVENKDLFEQHLAFVLAMDLEKVWVERFSGVLAQEGKWDTRYSPFWYGGKWQDPLDIAFSMARLGETLVSLIDNSSADTNH